AGRDTRVGSPLARVGREAPRAEPSAGRRLVDLDGLAATLSDLAGGLAAEVGNPALEVADARLARVLTRDEPQDVVVQLQLLRGEPVGLELLRHEVLARDS